MEAAERGDQGPIIFLNFLFEQNHKNCLRPRRHFYFEYRFFTIFFEFYIFQILPTLVGAKSSQAVSCNLG